ncbi:hypothetical protein IAD21_02605 [Abditibacteriota bacterium]|nr:hypothetical protein IAD21_02605 [Abditibacteriota bacterium]
MSFLSPHDTIWKATRRGDLDAVRKFAERDGIPDVKDDYDSQSLLTYACAAGHVDIVRFLWRRGVTVIIVGRAPEAFAAMENGHLDVLRLLCELGLDPFSTRYHKHGDYLIDLAIEQRRVEEVRLLLAHRGHIYPEYEDEMTAEEADHESDTDLPSPLELAARAGDIEFVAFLLEVGVDLKSQTVNYYLLKAQSNVPKYERRQQDEIEKELRGRLRSQRSSEDVSLFWGCTIFGIFALAFCWISYRLALWVGWWEFSLFALFFLPVYLNTKQKGDANS